jgi:putative membrane protein
MPVPTSSRTSPEQGPQATTALETPPSQTPTPPGHEHVKSTRTGATWVGIAVGAVVLVLLIIFLLQNTVPVEVAFLGLQGTAPLAVMLLIAGVGFAIVTLVVGSLRIGQLRRRIGRGDRAEAQNADAGR